MNQALLYLLCYFLIGMVVSIISVWCDKKFGRHSIDAPEAALTVLAWPLLLAILTVLFLGQLIIIVGDKL